MLELSKRMSLISKIVKEKPSLGKTAMMKFIFILQQVYKVPLGYDYEIYTYGPYSSEVMEDIQLAVDYNAISIDTVNFPSGYLGYELKRADKTETMIEEEQDFVHLYNDSISEVVHLFGNKTAKELELSSTIIYMYSNYYHNGWDNSIDEIAQSVKKIKPHFDISLIREEYRKLDNMGILKKSIIE